MRRKVSNFFQDNKRLNRQIHFLNIGYWLSDIISKGKEKRPTGVWLRTFWSQKMEAKWRLFIVDQDHSVLQPISRCISPPTSPTHPWELEGMQCPMWSRLLQGEFSKKLNTMQRYTRPMMNNGCNVLCEADYYKVGSPTQFRAEVHSVYSEIQQT